jgi:DNA-binding NarL/FixJ family response regulator
MRVLIVDDSKIVRERVVELLSELQDGIDVVGQAGEVTEAIGAVHRLKPDAVILDIGMPGGSGVDVLQAIKQVGLSPVIMMLTNLAHPQYRKRCMDIGADFFYDKSKEFCKVPETFRRLLREPSWDRTGDICDVCSKPSVLCHRPSA